MPQPRNPGRTLGPGHLMVEENRGLLPNLSEGQVNTPAPDLVSPHIPVPVPTYSLDVRLASVEQVLTALARDQRIDFELHPGVEGFVTLSVFNRPLPELIESLCDQANLRCEFDGKRLTAMPDTPFLRTYHIDYVNLTRDVNSSIATSTQIATTSSSAVDAKGSSSAGGGNASLTQIGAKATNHFWETLENNIRTILKEHERITRKQRCEATQPRKPGSDASCGGTEESAFVVSNRETGILVVLASASQHRKVAEFIDLVQGAAQRQVMVEATIVEVTLADGYRQGIDWNRLGIPAISMNPRGTNDNGGLQPSVSYLSDKLDVRLDWLETFGTVKVLSSPKLSVLNNQTAILKVVEEVVYFLVDASVTEYATNDRERTSATTKPQSVSVGLVMSVTPQIGRDGTIILAVRPTISSISGYKDDPNPSLGSIPNRVPQIRTREMESVLRLTDGETAVLGGLMEDKLDTDMGRIPLIGAIPLLGELFTRRQNNTQRTELVIFLRPRLIRRRRLRAGTNDATGYVLPAAGCAMNEPNHRCYSPSFYYQKHSETRQPREIGSEFARQVEDATGMERGWMDHDHSAEAGQHVEIPARPEATLRKHLGGLREIIKEVLPSARDGVGSMMLNYIKQHGDEEAEGLASIIESATTKKGGARLVVT
ncbi:MAG: secretin N-terminal domain-containing protein [Betaproteobacteria bacterium]|nr:secretin N-terminal domain-containing protein [Betaproteobacteria bacterium]